MVSWGDRGDQPLAIEDFDLPGQTVASYNTYNITHTSVAGESSKQFVELLQQRINSGYSRFLIRLMFSSESSDGDNQWDGVEYQLDDIRLKLTF